MVSTAFAALTGIALLAVVGLTILAFNLGTVFPQMPRMLLGDATLALGISGTVLLLGLPFGALWGAFLGYQRNDLVALSQAGARTLAAAGLIAAAALGGELVTLALAFAAAHLIGYMVTSITHVRHEFAVLRRSLVARASLRDLWSYSQTMLVWLICLFLINGVDTALVGKFEFQVVGLYGACAGATLTVAGIQQAIFGPLLQVAASHAGAGSPQLLPGLLSRTTRISTLVMLCLVMPVLVFAAPMLGAWLGPAQAHGGETVLRIMLTGHFLRLIWTPYSLVLLGTLKHREVMLMPIVEAIVNVVVAVAAGRVYGAVGVSMGVLVGALAGNMVTVLVSMRRTTELAPNRWILIRHGILRPAACFLPAIAAAVVASTSADEVGLKVGLGALLASAVVAWRWGLSGEERDYVRRLLGAAATRVGGQGQG